MIKDYQEITKDISGALSTLRQHVPDVLKGFSNLGKAATNGGELDKKTKELIALA